MQGKSNIGLKNNNRRNSDKRKYEYGIANSIFVPSKVKKLKSTSMRVSFLQ